MFRTSVRRFATTATRSAEAVAQAESRNATAYGISVSKAQGVVKGLTGGIPYI